MKRRFDMPPDASPSAETLAADILDEVVVRIPCYEPAGKAVELTRRDLCSHVLALGQTGSGKTTSACRWMIKNLIHHRAEDPAQRAAVFVCDFNGDDTLPLVTKWAREAGRISDLRILSEERGHLDLFAGMHRLDQLSTATSYLMHGQWANFRHDNAYWTETVQTLIDAGLTTCLAVEGRLHLKTVLRFLTNWLVAHQFEHADDELIGTFRRLCQHAASAGSPNVASKLRLAQTTLDMWARLDLRTKSVLTSMVLDAIGPLMAPETHRYLDAGRPSAFQPESLNEGLIMVFSIPAARQIESAALLGRIIKGRLWSSLQARPPDVDQRLCAVIADEYHLLASGGTSRASDVTALATLRSRSVAIVAATQSLEHLSGVMSPEQFRALLPNFGNHFFFRSVEASTANFATAIMGTKEVTRRNNHTLRFQIERKKPKHVAVCPPGSLTLLQPCQAFVSTASGFRSPEPLWLGSNQERPTSVISRSKAAYARESDPLAKLREKVLGPHHAIPNEPGITGTGQRVPLRLYYDLPTWKRLLTKPRYRGCSFASFAEFRAAFQALGQEPAGLETLPPCWWKSLVRLTRNFAEPGALNLLGLHQVDGCVEVVLGGDAGRADRLLAWIATLERSLYPVRSRALKPRDAAFIEAKTRPQFDVLEAADEDWA